MNQLEELAKKIQSWDIRDGNVPQEWLDEWGNLFDKQWNKKQYQKAVKSKEMRNRRRRGKYGEKKVSKEVGGRQDGGVGRKDVIAGMFSYEVKTIKKIPASIVKIMTQSERLKKRDTIAVGVFRCNSPREEYFILSRQDWLALHGKERR